MFLLELLKLHHDVCKDNQTYGTSKSTDYTKELFENAWTLYSDETYDHSVELVEKRLKLSGFDESYFKGKRCFDGGCGTGRLSLAMAKMGAEEVVAVDIGGESLNYFKKVVERYGLKNISFVEHDVTDLSHWKDRIFDFVASYGVLHHTPNPIKGIEEHMRITKIGGDFWLYLYGDGGFYWPIYDALRDVFKKIGALKIKEILIDLNVREGFIYTFLDNVLAPRTYHYSTDVINLLKKKYKISYNNAKGSSPIDDTEKCLTSKYGADIYGPEGEVRLIIQKIEEISN